MDRTAPRLTPPLPTPTLEDLLDRLIKQWLCEARRDMGLPLAASLPSAACLTGGWTPRDC